MSRISSFTVTYDAYREQDQMVGVSVFAYDITEAVLARATTAIIPTPRFQVPSAESRVLPAISLRTLKTAGGDHELRPRLSSTLKQNTGRGSLRLPGLLVAI